MATVDSITDWRSIVTLIVFVLANLAVLFPFHIPIYIPRSLSNLVLDSLSGLRVISPRRRFLKHGGTAGREEKPSFLLRINFPINFVTAPLIADLFLLAILAIGAQEVHDGTIGAQGISPIDIMGFFLTLAYIAISIDASGLIRYLAFKVVQLGGKYGHRLFFYLYAFFFCLGSFIGNDPIILSGTAFLAYMTRVSSNIVHPRAWIHTQFAVANVASAVLVSSNPTNLVLAGAFQIKFIWYTANMIVPVVATAIVLFPFLLYIVFANESLIPLSIKMYELPEEAKGRKPVNPNIPNARGTEDDENKKLADNDEGKLLSLEEIMNPFLDKGGAAFGAVIMTATLVTLLALNASTQSGKSYPVAYVTLPAAFVMFCWDLGFGWYNRKETREIARKGRQDLERARAERAAQAEEDARAALEQEEQEVQKEQDFLAPIEPDLMRTLSPETVRPQSLRGVDGPNSNAAETTAVAPAASDAQDKQHPALASLAPSSSSELGRDSTSPTRSSVSKLGTEEEQLHHSQALTTEASGFDEKKELGHGESLRLRQSPLNAAPIAIDEEMPASPVPTPVEAASQNRPPRATLVSLSADTYRWAQETFPTTMAVMGHLPFPLVPFALAMFVLVQALVTKGWVKVFAYGWDHWVNKTGTVGSVGGIGFLSVILCNFAGTNIGTAILLSRVIQAWQDIHYANNIPISDRTFWATVYGMALGVNFGAFSTAFSASLAGLLWRDILARKHIHVRRLEFARVNLPIIAIAMAVGSAVLIGEVYIMRGDQPYQLS